MPRDALSEYLAHHLEGYSEQWRRQVEGLGHVQRYVTQIAGESSGAERARLVAFAEELDLARKRIAYVSRELSLATADLDAP